MKLLFSILFISAHYGVSSQSLNSTSSSSPSTASGLPAGYTAVPQLPRNSSSTLKALYQPYSNQTPVFQNQELLQQLSSHPGAKANLLLSVDSSSLYERKKKKKRQSDGTLPTGTCAPGVPCTNGACCSNTGVCSYAPSSCGADVCISNCDAKAPCGEYADPSNATCPLQVCCSQYGFCGTIDAFCGTGCQEGYGECGPAPSPSCAASGNSASQRRIGYYESWATTRPCDVVTPEDLELTGMTHINFAFTYFDPSTFQITPMDANSAALYARFTALKTKQPGLETWLSIGGWSFNDATNTPNTQNAFSNMVSSAGNRQAFITSLRNFMQTYGFDGVDIDWEYPAADDRGGVAADFANFPTFLAELRASFGSGLGISTTLPSSYWYLQHFDLVNMEPSVDWFNFMSYDIHGVWDSSDVFVGPYIAPHTNLTEIEDGLSLLWRNSIDPSKVVLGLGWYGRSFTLADPSCSTPNGVCQFTTGGTAGACTQSSGTLSNAEIKRILASGVGVESYDETAAVRWLTWDTNQWVSFDDGITMQQKLAAANSLCLGGVMIWSLDQDNTAGDSMNDLLGIGTANGVTEAEAESFKDQMANATLQQAIASSCYWSLCGDTCTTGYFGVTDARGQVAGVQQNSVCDSGEYQTLCCAPGTTMGTCQWEGFRGVGFPCSPACSDSSATIVAQNTNSYQVNDGGQTADLTCTGGYQAYCCSGFVPSSITNSGNLVLYGQDTTSAVSKRAEMDGIIHERGVSVQKRGAVLLGGLGALCLDAVAGGALGALITFGVSAGVAGLICAATGIAAAAAVGFAILSGLWGWLFGGSPSQPNTGVPTTIGTRTAYGQWPLLDFNGAATTTSCDCSVTYTCRYGLGWDEVCDNQRWAITKVLNGQNVFHPLAAGRPANRQQTSWATPQRNAAYRTLVQGTNRPLSARCQVDEFPMGNLREAAEPAPQACRLVNGPANGAQGRDYGAWKSAQWKPCSTYRSTKCHITDDGPPATWEFGPLNGNRGPGSGQHFIDAFGFDSQTPNSLCFASYTYTVNPGTVTNTMITDHAFRVLDDDPMYGSAYGWPRQSYRSDPAPTSNGGIRPYNLQPGIFQRDQLPIIADNTTFTNDTELGADDDSSPTVCHIDVDHQDAANGGDDARLDYDHLLFIDMNGKFVDGRTCDIIYEDTAPGHAAGARVRVVVDQDGKVVDMYMDDDDAGLWEEQHEAPLTEAESAFITATTGGARPPSELFPTVPTLTTTVSLTATASMVTVAPL